MVTHAAPGPAPAEWDAGHAVTVLYGTHYHSLVRLAALLTGNVATAEEVVQDSFAALHASWRRLRDPGKALSYLRQSVVHRTRTAPPHRAVPGRNAPQPPPAAPGTGQGAMAGLERCEVVCALRRLPARQREALVLRYYCDLPDAQIASAMGISKAAVNSHTERGMSSLRTILQTGPGLRSQPPRRGPRGCSVIPVPDSVVQRAKVALHHPGFSLGTGLQEPAAPEPAIMRAPAKRTSHRRMRRIGGTGKGRSARLHQGWHNEPGPRPGRARYRRIVATKAERRAARDRVSAYHQVQLAELLSQVEAAIDRYRAGEIDAYAMDETIHHYHRAATELWKFCFAHGGGTHAAFIADLIDRMTADAEAIDWWERATPRRHQ